MSNLPKTLQAIRDGEFKTVEKDQVDYILDDNSSLTHHHINLAPLSSATPSQRNFYTHRFFSQTDPLVKAEAPLIQTNAKGGKSWEQSLGTKVGAIMADDDAEVVEVNEQQLRLRSASGEERTIPLYHHYALNRKNQLHQTPLVAAGDKVKAGQVLARSNFTDDQGTLAIGRNAHIGVVPYLGYSMDDATVISRSFADNLTSNHLLDFEALADEGVQRDKQHYTSIFQGRWSKDQLSKINNQGVVKPGTVLQKGDPIYLGTAPHPISQQDIRKGTFGKYLRNRRKDVSQVWDEDVDGIVRDVVQRRDGSYAITVEANKPATEGDKLVVRSGNKFTISKILEDKDMPRTKSGEVFDMLANPLGIPSRVGLSFPYEIALGKVAKKLGRPLSFDSYTPSDSNWADIVQQYLDDNDVQAEEEVWDPIYQQYLENPIMTGNAYILKLQHQAAGKLSSRDEGGYTQWEQPRKGGDELGQAKRASGLELTGLLSAGAYGYIKDGMTVRGQKNDEYWRAIRAGQTPPKPGHPFAWDKVQALLHGAGYGVTNKGRGVQRLGPLTDKDLDRFKAEELENAELLDFKTLQPVAGGLFDEVRDFRGAWGKISLDYPLPNPAFEKPMVKLLGIKNSQLDSIIRGKEELEGYGTGSEALYKKLRDIDPAKLRTEMMDIVRSGSKTKRGRAIDVLNTLEGLERNQLQPKDLMITQVPVIPGKYRPYSFQGETFLAGDVNELYRDLFALRDQNRRVRDTFGTDATNEHRGEVYAGLKALYGQSTTANPKLKEKGVEGFLKQILGTSPKYSVFQRNLFSKTVDSSARGVAGLDPTLGIDEVGIPESTAWKLYGKYVQGRLVRSGMKPAQALQEVVNRTPLATKNLEHELRERPGVVNRAPAWHKHSSLGAYFKIHKGHNIQVNPLIAPGMNLDFNGDMQIGYVIMRATKEHVTRLFKKGLTRVIGHANIQAMYKDIQLPVMGKNEEVAVVDLADFPRENLIKEKVGQNGRILFYTVPEGTKVISYDEQARKPIWADISYFSIHLEREVEIVNLTGRAQIITDNDPRAVYGINPNQPGFKMERFTPTQAKDLNVVVARGRTNHELCSEEGVVKEWEFGGKTVVLTPEFGYFLGAMAGDGWTDTKGGNAWYLADLEGHTATAIKTWLEGLYPDLQYKVLTMEKANDSTRYGDTTRHTFRSLNDGHAITNSLKQLLGGERDEHTAGSGNKRLPTFAGMAPRVFIEGLLAGLLDTDGTITNTKPAVKKQTQLTVSITSTSLGLLRMAKFLFSLLGMNSTISYSKKTKADNDAWLLVVSAVDAFHKLGPIVRHMRSPHKCEAFKLSVQPSEAAASYQRTQMVPLTITLHELLYKACPAPKRTAAVERDAARLEIIKTFNALKVSIGRCARTKDYRVSRANIKQFFKLYELYPQYFNNTNLQALYSSSEWSEFIRLYETAEICWLSIESVEYTRKRETGYDLTVPGYETFMNSDGVILSNTLGIFVPSLPEAVKDVKERLIPSRQIFSIRDEENVVNTLAQDLLLGLYEPANTPSEKVHTFQTREDALKAIKQGKVSLKDEVMILEDVVDKWKEVQVQN